MEELASIIGSFGWPQASLVFALIFIAVFYKPLRDFIGNIKSVGKEGITTETIPRAQNEETRKQAVDELMRLGDSPLILEGENIIKSDLERRDLEATSDSVKVLMRHLAATQLALDFEQIHGMIFGSQIFLLKKLNEVAAQGAEKEFVETHYKNVQELFPKVFGSWSTEQYLNFLFARSLITVGYGRYRITVKGAEFLVWLVKTGHREDRS
ncbi:MAG: hypothetical protein HY273_00205, partial [Gammaproteobacteria bacterium]|nr:hypothetical protein [Gammaproteobacteria bacterium]